MSSAAGTAVWIHGVRLGLCCAIGLWWTQAFWVVCLIWWTSSLLRTEIPTCLGQAACSCNKPEVKKHPDLQTGQCSKVTHGALNAWSFKENNVPFFLYSGLYVFFLFLSFFVCVFLYVFCLFFNERHLGVFHSWHNQVQSSLLLIILSDGKHKSSFTH